MRFVSVILAGGKFDEYVPVEEMEEDIYRFLNFKSAVTPGFPILISQSE